MWQHTVGLSKSSKVIYDIFCYLFIVTSFIAYDQIHGQLVVEGTLGAPICLIMFSNQLESVGYWNSFSVNAP